MLVAKFGATLQQSFERRRKVLIGDNQVAGNRQSAWRKIDIFRQVHRIAASIVTAVPARENPGSRRKKMHFTFDPHSVRSHPMNTVRNLRVRKVAGLLAQCGTGRRKRGTISGTATPITRSIAAHAIYQECRNLVPIQSAANGSLRCSTYRSVPSARRPVRIPVPRQDKSAARQYSLLVFAN